MHYFFGSIKDSENLVRLEGEEAHHCAVVLRLKAGEKIGVLDVSGKIYLAELISVHKKECLGKITSIKEYPPPKTKLHLVISPPKNNERLEWLIEKSVELQVWSLQFALSDRCIRKGLNLERLTKIRNTAAKQSGNPYLPLLFEYKSLNQFIEALPTSSFHSNSNLHLVLHCYEYNKINFDLTLLQQIKNLYSNVYAYIGPEGDWTIKEIEIIKQKLTPVLDVHLGDIRLRIETAAINVAALIKCVNT